MKLTVFHAGKGDCLLLTAPRARVLVDGGMRADYVANVADALGRLRTARQNLDLVYVSHIDRDHISGVLQLMEDEVDWRVFRFQRSQGNGRFPEPKRRRPPKVKNVWHNAFHEQVGDNAGEIEDLLAAKATVLEASAKPKLRALAADHRDLATSIGEGIELSRRVGPEQLGIPLNKQFAGRLAFARDGQAPIRLGKLTITVIGPFEEDLDKLRTEWNTWLQENREEHDRILRRMQREVDRLHLGEVSALRQPLELASGEIGERSKVTTPNLASLMLLVEEDGQSVLLTGDGHFREILRGLEKAGRLPERSGLHVDVLKVQHHGSENNLKAAFARRVTADTYVFCANGEHANPDLRVVKAIIDSRLGPNPSPNPEAGRDFSLEFNSASKTATNAKNRDHMRKVERLVSKAAGQSGNRMTFAFHEEPSFELDLD